VCGFWPYADWLARTKGVWSVLFGQCGTGASQCPAGNPADQWRTTTTAAVTWARTNGADGPITLVGASAGGVMDPGSPPLTQATRAQLGVSGSSRDG
jgi:alpha-beta hydrolase superfamily lysophospholipase